MVEHSPQILAREEKITGQLYSWSCLIIIGFQLAIVLNGGLQTVSLMFVSCVPRLRILLLTQ